MSLDKPFQASGTAFPADKYEESQYEAKRVEIVKELIPQSRCQKAIDIGCGPGYFARELSNRGWRTTCIDTDRKNVELAKNVADEIYLGDGLRILSKLPASQYDLILSLEIIEHMPKKYGENLLVEIVRVLKPYGRLIISTPNKLSLEGIRGYYWGEKIRRKRKWNAWDATHIHIYSSLEILQLVKSRGLSIHKIIGYWYESKLPFIGWCRLPVQKSTIFPLNIMGFNIILDCYKK